MAPRMYGIPCKLSKLEVIYLILSLINLGITNGFKCFLIVKQIFFIIIDVIFFAMITPHIHKEFPLPSHARAIVTLVITRMFSFMFVFLLKTWTHNPNQ
jgi:hypothetical protein